MTIHDLAVYKSIIAFVRLAHEEGFMRSGGNVSRRLNRRTYMITPHGCISNQLGRTSYGKMCKITYDGTNLSPKNTPSNEVLIHTKIYNLFSEVNAIFHAHTPNILPFICDERGICEEFRIKILNYGNPFISLNLLEDLSEKKTTMTEYGIMLIVPDHGVFVGSSSLEKAHYLVCKYDDIAKTILNKKLLVFEVGEND